MLKELLNDHQLYHSEFQQDHYITGRAGGTLYGQYKQALRELYKRFRGLREAHCDRKKLEIEIEENLYKTEHGGMFEKQYAKIEHERKVMQREEIERLIKDTKREFKRFYQQAIVLKEQIGELTDEKRRQLDKEMHVFKLKEMAVFDFVITGHLSKQTYEFLMAFPKEDRIKLAYEIKRNNQKLVEEYENRDDGYFETLPEIEDSINLKCLLEN